MKKDRKTPYDDGVAALGRHARSLVPKYSRKNRIDLEQSNRTIKAIGLSTLQRLVIDVYDLPFLPPVAEIALLIAAIVLLPFGYLKFRGIELGAAGFFCLAMGLTASLYLHSLSRRYQAVRSRIERLEGPLVRFFNDCVGLMLHIGEDKGTPWRILHRRLLLMATDANKLAATRGKRRESARERSAEVRRKMERIAAVASRFGILKADVDGIFKEARQKARDAARRKREKALIARQNDRELRVLVA